MRKIEDHARETEGMGLKELVLAKEKMLSEKGYYLDDLPYKREHVVDFEIFYAKLLQIAQNARQVLRYVAGSPIVREGGECICGLYTPEGHAAVLSVGVLLHIYSMSEVIRFMALNDYEDNPGVKEGDFFFNNDPHCGGQHAQDQFIITPIFYRDRLVGWTGAMSHEPEVGATGPGGYDLEATSRFYEGLLLSPTKIASGDVLHTDYRITVEHSTRDATFWLLDTQAKMSACIFVREEIKKLIDKYGVELYLDVMQEIIEDGRRSALGKVRERFVRGIYRARGFYDFIVPNRGNRCCQVMSEMSMDDEGNLTVDMEGTSPEGVGPHQGTLPATKGTFFCGLAQTLMYDCRFNAGTYLVLRSHIPPGSVHAVSLQAATSKYIGSPGAVLTGTLFDQISRMYYAAGYPEEVITPVTTNTSLPFTGKDYSGRTFAGTEPGSTARGSGASAVRDGLDTHYTFFNPEGDFTDAEIAESSLAVKFLGRRHWRDGSGFGKFRGGVGLDGVLMIHEATSPVLMNAGGADYYMPTSQGLMGGYPSPPCVISLALNTNVRELFEQRLPYPVAFGDVADMELTRYLRGDLKLHIPPSIPNTYLKNKDVVERPVNSASGFGDPLERQPDPIVKDLINGITSERAARDVYGIVVRRVGHLPQQIVCDTAETEALRARMREERKQRGVPAAEYFKRQRQRLIAGEIPKVCANMINELMAFSPKWKASFKREWQLPDEFEQIAIKD